MTDDEATDDRVGLHQTVSGNRVMVIASTRLAERTIESVSSGLRFGVVWQWICCFCSTDRV